MRGRLWGVGVASLVVCIAVVFAAGVKAQTPSGIAGTWKLDVAKSTFSPGPAPKSMTVTYTPIKDGVRIKVDLDAASGCATLGHDADVRRQGLPDSRESRRRHHRVQED